jgi:hypothetical protein
MQWPKALFCLALVALIGMTALSASAQPRERELPWKVSNLKAIDAESGDPALIDRLADDALTGSQLFEMAGATNPDLKAALVNAELEYINKKHSGVTDANVADAMNALAKLVGAPPFAYTDKTEVRRLRMRMMLIMPALFARELRRTEKNGKSHIRENMSPIESVYLFARLIDQKISNPAYQLTAQERRERWGQLHQPLQPPSTEPNRRTRELEDAVFLASSKTSLRDLSLAATDVILTLVAHKGGK